MAATAPARTARGLRLFSGPRDAPRARRATDGLLLGGAALGLVVLSVAAFPPSNLDRATASFLAAWPHVLEGIWQAVGDLLVVLGVVLVVTALIGRRAGLARDLVAAVAVASAGWLLVARSTVGAWPAVSDALDRAAPPALYPAARVALPAAVVFAASPHLTAPARRFGRYLVGLAALGAAVLGATTPSGAIAGVVLGLGAAAAAHLAFGSSAGRPSLERVRLGLAEIGVAAVRLEAADRQEAGLFVVDAEDEAGRSLVIKVYGRDALDTALVSTLWRTVWFRDAGTPARLGRLHQVEHEAFLTLLAGQAGVPTDAVVAAGSTFDGNALLVLRRAGQSLTARDDPIGDADLRSVWDALERLHEARISHGRFDDRAVIEVDGTVGVVDLRGAALAAGDAPRRTDQAQALVTTVLLSDPPRALAVARERLGADGLGAVLPYLQAPALTASQRRELRKREIGLDDLRTAAAELAAVEPPALLQLRRITVGSIVRVVLPALALVMLISAVGGLDLGLLVDRLATASWWLVAVGVVVAQLPRLTQSVSTLGAAPVPVPLAPLYALQLAVSYVNLAVPSAAARVAVNIRFFQRHGVAPGTAVAAGALDGFAGFVVQAGLLAGLLLLTPASLDLDLGSGPSGAMTSILVLVVVAALVAVSCVVAVARWRRFVLQWAQRLGTEAIAALRGLRSPRRLGLLFGGNLATEVLFATSLGIFARALGHSVGLDELLLINISVALLAGLLPVPGGIGVAEGGLMLGLTQAGLPEEDAFAVVILYRMASFYLPPIWGFFALRWLERNEHL